MQWIVQSLIGPLVSALSQAMFIPIFSLRNYETRHMLLIARTGGLDQGGRFGTEKINEAGSNDTGIAAQI